AGQKGQGLAEFRQRRWRQAGSGQRGHRLGARRLLVESEASSAPAQPDAVRRHGLYLSALDELLHEATQHPGLERSREPLAKLLAPQSVLQRLPLVEGLQYRER